MFRSTFSLTTASLIKFCLIFCLSYLTQPFILFAQIKLLHALCYTHFFKVKIVSWIYNFNFKPAIYLFIYLFILSMYDSVGWVQITYNIILSNVIPFDKFLLNLYFENLTDELHILYVFNIHVKFWINLKLFIIWFIKSYFMHNFKLQKFEI